MYTNITWQITFLSAMELNVMELKNYITFIHSVLSGIYKNVLLSDYAVPLRGHTIK
jgi:hypothetical protein